MSAYFINDEEKTTVFGNKKERIFPMQTGEGRPLKMGQYSY